MSVINGLATVGDFEKFTDKPYGKLPGQQLDIYVPKKTEPHQPVVVFFYGGCWGACRTYSKDAYDFVGDTFTAAGYIVVLTDYRLYPEALFDEIMSDATNSVKWVHNNIADYGGNPDNIFLMGHSAGAHIAALLATNETYLGTGLKAVRGFVGLAGPYDFLPFDQSYMLKLFAGRDAESQPVNFVNGNEPPHLLLHGLADRRVDPRNAESLAKHLQQQGIVHQHLTYTELGHGKLLAALSRPLKNRYPVTQDIINFIEKHAK
ncbi:alpha/beta hydrolase [Marinicella sp. W31]|uniref:alpha/beta hydrolase n=1 Tax=Marinicella sp. W31 TaxID=3023713 RepID=UPI003758368E